MKIIDSFLFSEVYEKELLLLKFNLEDKGVDEWLILENAYSFQGNYIGLHAKELLSSDDRFKPFIHKIKIISETKKTMQLSGNELQDSEAFKAEFWQRNLAYDYFINNYENNDWIIISDVDESIDFSDANRRETLINRIKRQNEEILHVSTKRYWFDFDNEYKILYGIPMCTKKHLLKNNYKLHDVRLQYHADLKMEWDIIIAFEYTSCFQLKDIMRKSNTYSHTCLKENEMRQALRCNHRPLSHLYNVSVQNNNRFFFEKIALTKDNSPSYVRDNFLKLKTDNIDSNYKLNRKKDYPELFTIKYYLKQFAEKIERQVQKKFRYALRKLKMEKLIYGSSVH